MWNTFSLQPLVSSVSVADEEIIAQVTKSSFALQFIKHKWWYGCLCMNCFIKITCKRVALTYRLVPGEEGEPGAAEIGSGDQGLGLENDGARQDQSAMTCRKSEWVWMSNVKNDIKLALRNLSYIFKSDCCDYSNKTKGQVVCDVFTWAGGYPLVWH